MIFLVSLRMFLDIYANKYTITLQPPRLFLFWLLSFPSSRIKSMSMERRTQTVFETNPLVIWSDPLLNSNILHWAVKYKEKDNSQVLNRKNITRLEHPKPTQHSLISTFPNTLTAVKQSCVAQSAICDYTLEINSGFHFFPDTY